MKPFMLIKYYKVKVIQATAPNVYHVVCTNNNITDSSHSSYEAAMEKMRELNRIERQRIKNGVVQ